MLDCIMGKMKRVILRLTPSLIVLLSLLVAIVAVWLVFSAPGQIKYIDARNEWDAYGGSPEKIYQWVGAMEFEALLFIVAMVAVFLKISTVIKHGNGARSKSDTNLTSI